MKYQESGFDFQIKKEKQKDDIFEAFYEDHKKWYFAVIKEADWDVQRFKVVFLRTEEERSLMGI